MIGLDTNILVHAHRQDSPWHAEARTAVESLASSGRAWCIPWPCVSEFLAIVTNPRVFSPPTPLRDALAVVDGWLECETLVMISETPGSWPVMRGVYEDARLAGGQVHDGRIAALCIQHGVSELWTADRDFSRFGDLTVRNPLTKKRR